MQKAIVTGVILAAAAVGGLGYVYHHPQLIVGRIQAALYKGKPINSYEPFGKSGSYKKEDGTYYVTEIAYGKTYPNSYLDITYPTEDLNVQRPTVVYFHGGGYFGGDKAMGDPMAVEDDANRLFAEIVANGYNFVNVNYALVPEYHFPVPLIQMNQAMDYLQEHAETLHLDMEHVIIFGQSAGAILAGQYGALLTDASYRELMEIEPKLPAECVKALIIDDAPYYLEKGSLGLKLLLGNYLQTMHFDEQTDKRYNAVRYINAQFPPCFLTAGNTDGFPGDMRAFSEKLIACGVEQEFYFNEQEVCKLPHGYLNMVNENKYARECFDHILAFMEKYGK